MANRPGRSFKQKAIGEMKHLSIVVVYVWVLLAVFRLHRAIILGQHGIEYAYVSGLIFAFVNACILGKFILIGEALHMGERPNGPLIYTIFYRSAVFSAILVVCHMVEDTLRSMWRAGSFLSGLPELSAATLIDEFSFALIVFVALIPFFAVGEFSRIFGRSEFQSLLFQRHANNAVSRPTDTEECQRVGG